jgi:tetratricopeptide (TPR) repeat protein
MIRNPFNILGVSENVTQNELYEAYQTERARYSGLRFVVGEEGTRACEMLDEIELAYKEASEILASRVYVSDAQGELQNVESLIKSNNFEAAQNILDRSFNRSAEWHYLQAIIFYKKMWFNEARGQLHAAIEKDPFNEKYQTSLKTLEQKLNQNPYAGRGFYAHQGDDRTYRGTPIDSDDPAMRGCGCCECCAALACVDCLCSGLGGCC